MGDRVFNATPAKDGFDASRDRLTYFPLIQYLSRKSTDNRRRRHTALALFPDSAEARRQRRFSAHGKNVIATGSDMRMLQHRQIGDSRGVKAKLSTPLLVVLAVSGLRWLLRLRFIGSRGLIAVLPYKERGYDAADTPDTDNTACPLMPVDGRISASSDSCKGNKERANLAAPALVRITDALLDIRARYTLLNLSAVLRLVFDEADYSV